MRVKPDVINTYQVWLRHKLLRGRFDPTQFEVSDGNVTAIIR